MGYVYTKDKSSGRTSAREDWAVIIAHAQASRTMRPSDRGKLYRAFAAYDSSFVDREIIADFVDVMGLGYAEDFRDYPAFFDAILYAYRGQFRRDGSPDGGIVEAVTDYACEVMGLPDELVHYMDWEALANDLTADVDEDSQFWACYARVFDVERFKSCYD